MSDAYVKRILACLLCVVSVAATGCAKMGGGPSWVPFLKKADSRVPGVSAPHERIQQIREMAKEADRASESRKREVVAQLSASMRTEEDSMIRAECVRALGEYFDAGAEAVLRASLSDPDAEVREAACEAWGKQPGAETVAVLGGVLTGDIDLDVRLAAARALGRSKDPAAVTVLGEALEDRDPAMQYRAMLSLRKVTGKDFGVDVNRWQQYVRGETPKTEEPFSMAERFGKMFYD